MRLKKYYKIGIIFLSLVIILYIGHFIWIKLFYFKFGKLPTVNFVNSDRKEIRYLRDALTKVKLEDLKFKKCKVYLASKSDIDFAEVRKIFFKIGIPISLVKERADFKLYKFNSARFEGLLYKYNVNTFINILLVRGDKASFIKMLANELGRQVEGNIYEDYPIIGTDISFRIDQGMGNMLRISLVKYKVKDSTLYKCLDIKQAVRQGRLKNIPRGMLVKVTQISLPTANIPALEGGIRVVTDDTYPSPFSLDNVERTFVAVNINEEEVYLYPAYLLNFKSEGSVKSRVGDAFIAREGRVVLPAIAPDWYNK